MDMSGYPIYVWAFLGNLNFNKYSFKYKSCLEGKIKEHFYSKTFKVNKYRLKCPFNNEWHAVTKETKKSACSVY